MCAPVMPDKTEINEASARRMREEGGEEANHGWTVLLESCYKRLAGFSHNLCGAPRGLICQRVGYGIIFIRSSNPQTEKKAGIFRIKLEIKPPEGFIVL